MSVYTSSNSSYLVYTVGISTHSLDDPVIFFSEEEALSHLHRWCSEKYGNKDHEVKMINNSEYHIYFIQRGYLRNSTLLKGICKMISVPLQKNIISLKYSVCETITTSLDSSLYSIKDTDENNRIKISIPVMNSVEPCSLREANSEVNLEKDDTLDVGLCIEEICKFRKISEEAQRSKSECISELKDRLDKINLTKEKTD